MSTAQRYNGRDLGTRPHIAVLGSCKVGNFVVTLPLLRALRRRYPAATIDFWGSEATRDFEDALCSPPADGNAVSNAGASKGDPPSALLNWRTSWDLAGPEHFQGLAAAAAERVAAAGPLDLLINCDGFNPLTQVLASWLRPTWVAGGALSANGRRELPWGEHPYQRFLADPDWDAPAFVERYGGLFASNYIAELLCRLAFLEPTPQELQQIELPWVEPPFAVPQVLIHCTTTRAAKIWPFEHWAAVLRWCAERGISVGLVGAPPARQAAEYHAGAGEEQLLAEFGETSKSRGSGSGNDHDLEQDQDQDQDRAPLPTLIDLRGRTSLIELAGACRAAQAVVSVDAGPLHIAAAVGTPVLAVVGNDSQGVGASPMRLWLPRAPQLQRTVSSTSCDGCEVRRYRNDGCVAERHHCMEGVDAAQVVNWLARELD